MTALHELRCTGCATRVAGDQTPSDFRCLLCGSLFEVIYPWSDQPRPDQPRSECAARQHTGRDTLRQPA